MADPLAKIKAYYFALLPSITEEQWWFYEQKISIRTYKKGDLILRPGQICDTVSFINSGLVRFYHLLDGKELVAGFFDEEQPYFSDYESFLTRKPSPMYIEAIEATEVADINYEGVQLLYDTVEAADRLGRYIAEGLYTMLSARNNAFLLDSPEQRYQKLLEQRPGLFQRVPQYMIASYLGVTPEALSRIRARLSKKASGSAH